MLNQIIVVGRIVKEPVVGETVEGRKVCEITLAVPRSFKNEEGVYDTDFIDCTLFEMVAENVKEYCKQGDVVGVKGRLSKLEGEVLHIVAEKVTFLSSKTEEKEEGENE